MSVDIENFASEDVEMSTSRLRGNDSSDQGGRPAVVSIWQQSSGEAGISVVNESDQRCDLQGNRLQSTSISVGDDVVVDHGRLAIDGIDRLREPASCDSNYSCSTCTLEYMRSTAAADDYYNNVMNAQYCNNVDVEINHSIAIHPGQAEAEAAGGRSSSSSIYDLLFTSDDLDWLVEDLDEFLSLISCE
ncbi:hypothetical protein GOP47_0030584 [Adiantum capillus-veneris]|nr:hypothetical protein GOP47_0030584 [Adiantum capillus-veneris]